MLNTDKLIYILPDVAYLVELLPGKKPHSYAVSNFRQINGKFLDDNELISASIIKLLAKFEKDTYQLILPDFLFTNTIINVKESSETKVKEYIKEKLLPQLNLSSKTHQIQYYVLTEHKGIYKVQLSAIENSVLSSIKSAAKEYNLVIKKIYPLSWTTKSLISLEPSISVIQMGSRVYLAQHYIGIDQTNDASVDEVENLLETIKTLKGAEPSIQTVYLASNSLIEKKFKEGLSNTLPLQQLVVLKDEELKMPTYIKLLIEAGMKTLSVPDFNLPEFNFAKVVADPQAKSLAQDAVKQKEDMPTDKKNKLPKPIQLEEAEETKFNEVVKPIKVEIDEITVPTNIESKDSSQNLDKDEPGGVVEKSTKTTIELNDQVKPIEKSLSKIKSSKSLIPESETQEKGVNLAQFAEQSNDDSSSKIKISQKLILDKKEKSMSETKDKVIKNKDRVGGMLKTIFIFLASVSITVAIGIGLGLGFIKFTNKNDNVAPAEEISVVAEVSPTPDATPVPTAEPEPEIDKAKYKILVVNATTIAGHAGKIKTALESAEFKNVKAANAKGEYEAGVYVLLEKENSGIIKLLSESIDLELKFAEGKDIEDAADSYDAVIVLAE